VRRRDIAPTTLAAKLLSVPLYETGFYTDRYSATVNMLLLTGMFQDADDAFFRKILHVLLLLTMMMVTAVRLRCKIKRKREKFAVRDLAIS